MYLGYIFAGVLVASQASAAALNGLLYARQSASDLLTGLPEQCQSACLDVSTILSDCGTGIDSDKCACKSTTVTAIEKCFKCLVDLAGLGGATAKDLVEKNAQQVLDQLKTSCKAGGYPVDGSSKDTSTVASQATATTSKPAATASDASAATSTSGDSGSPVGASSLDSLPGIGNGASRLELGLGAAMSVAVSIFVLL